MRLNKCPRKIMRNFIQQNKQQHAHINKLFATQEIFALLALKHEYRLKPSKYIWALHYAAKIG